VSQFSIIALFREGVFSSSRDLNSPSIIVVAYANHHEQALLFEFRRKQIAMVAEIQSSHKISLAAVAFS